MFICCLLYTSKHCKGKKYSSQHEQYRIADLSIGDFMTLPFDQLLSYVDKLISEITDSGLIFMLNNIRQFVSKAIDFHLGYLCLHRAIPTLSGGELQRLRMVPVSYTHLIRFIVARTT